MDRRCVPMYVHMYSRFALFSRQTASLVRTRSTVPTTPRRANEGPYIGSNALCTQPALDLARSGKSDFLSTDGGLYNTHGQILRVWLGGVVFGCCGTKWRDWKNRDLRCILKLKLGERERRDCLVLSTLLSILILSCQSSVPIHRGWARKDSLPTSTSPLVLLPRSLNQSIARPILSSLHVASHLSSHLLSPE